jgi:GrpB-like predicted nucleotidyltransferase (UPF0157 family)
VHWTSSTGLVCDAAEVEARRPRGPSTREAAARDLARTGGKDAPIEIVEYDPAWPARFASERERLQRLLPATEIHHIGSTAVPGMPAKPVIDLMALVPELDAPIAALVGRGGYQYPEAFNATLRHRRWLCRPSAAHRTHHLHLVVEPSELACHLHFRDRLRASASLRDEYARLKRGLAERLSDDREAYSEAKSAFIRRVEAHARDEL